MSRKEEVLNLHPCFGKVPNKGRIHLPVSPGCNIQCNFCDRKINDFENRPGVTAHVIKPKDTLEVIKRAMELSDNLTVAGIAGPGDTLATDNAIESFRLIKEQYPQLLKCMSTNGLLLNERAEELIELGIDTLTVTVNAVDPQILSQIVSKIVYHKKTYEGIEAAEILIHNQLEGIKKMARAKTTIKVNTVLINEINKDHIPEIAKAVKEAGADLYNIIPLIPQYKLSFCEEPQCEDIDGVRREAEKYINVFRHCQRCRADAIGIPGKTDISKQVYGENLSFTETFSHG